MGNVYLFVVLLKPLFVVSIGTLIENRSKALRSRGEMRPYGVVAAWRSDVWLSRHSAVWKLDLLTSSYQGNGFEPA